LRYYPKPQAHLAHKWLEEEDGEEEEEGRRKKEGRRTRRWKTKKKNQT